jgi:hypothetical protein
MGHSRFKLTHCTTTPPSAKNVRKGGAPAGLNGLPENAAWLYPHICPKAGQMWATRELV